ncbi:MAG: RtcB family protein [Nanoarchaeota archaeon]|nr:RtcB family protein [Nanoarchaeota archaeon]
MKITYFLPPEQIEESARKQIELFQTLPFIRGIAIMADVHAGKGCCVGSVIATEGAISPSFAGVDLGCGMIATKTKFFAKDLPESMEATRKGIERRIPLGAGNFNNEVSMSAGIRNGVLMVKAAGKDHATMDNKWHKALGTLGSGNHFIEISLDENDQVWIVLHSGSRGIGNQLATKHIKIAQKMTADAKINLLDPDLAYLQESTPEFKNYIDDMLWAQEFARFNREEMMDRVLTEMSFLFFKENGHQEEIELERINCHHNFTQQEIHGGNKVWLTRKGAIEMKQNQLGIIPGSMSTSTYIVSGLANPLSFNSAPHGAGRNYSRSAAKKKFTMEDLKQTMKNIEWNPKEAFIDEISLAYKPINQVMENSKDLVQIVHTLRQIVNIKGD